MIQLHRLEGFYWVAKTRGYARAARAFPYPITQPAVHQQVKKLEAELGVALFERVGKDVMQLTPAGQRLFRFVGPFFEQLPGVVRSLGEGTYGGDLHLVTSGMLLRHLVPSWVKRLTKRCPELRVHVRESAQPDLVGLRAGSADLVVDYIHRVPDDVATLQVATLRPFVIMPKGHPAARRKRLNLAAFKEDTFVSYEPESLQHRLQLRALARHDVAPPRTLSVSTADAIVGFVELGLGYSIVPSLDASGPRAKGVAVLPLEAPKIEFPVWAAWRKDAPENPLLDAALETAPRPS